MEVKRGQWDTKNETDPHFPYGPSQSNEPGVNLITTLKSDIHFQKVA